MAWEGPHALKLTGMVAGEDLSAKQFHFVKVSANNEVEACGGATDVPIGVLQNTPDDGEEAEIVCIGVTKIVADEQLAAGNLIGTSGDGQAQVIASGTDTTVYVAGVVLTGAATAGNIGTAVVNCAAPARAA